MDPRCVPEKILKKEKRLVPRSGSMPLPKPPGEKSRSMTESSLEQNSTEANNLDNYTYEEAKTICLEYSEMVKIFKPLIVQNLLVHDILPSLPFLENHDTIYEEMKNHSSKNAVVSLLDELEKSRELGKWHKFIDALSANGYTYIVDNIRGYKFVSHEYQKEYIRKITPKIGKMIMPCELLPYLLAKNIISDTDNENIRQEGVNRGPFAAAVLLLDRIQRKHGNWYRLFIEALLEAGMDDVAANLQIPELLNSKRTKVTDVRQDESDFESDECSWPYDLSESDSDTYGEYPLPAGLKEIYSYEDESPTPGVKDGTCAKHTFKEDKDEYDETSDVLSASKDTHTYTQDHALENCCLEYKKTTSVIHNTTNVKERRLVPLPIWTNADLEQFAYDIKSFPCKLKKTYDVDGGRDDTANDDGTYDDTCVQSHKEDNVALGVTSDGECPMIKSLQGEVERMKKKFDDINTALKLQEQKASLNENIDIALKKIHSLERENILKEKKRQALQSIDFTKEENVDEQDDKTAKYYPAATETNPSVSRENGNDHPGKQTIDFSKPFLLGHYTFSVPPQLHIESPLSVIQVYSPTFESRSSISRIFEKDCSAWSENALEFI